MHWAWSALPLLDPLLPCAGTLLHVALNPGRHRLGGSALAQCYGQLGDICPDVDNPSILAAAFRVTQELLEGKWGNQGNCPGWC